MPLRDARGRCGARLQRKTRAGLGRGCGEKEYGEAVVEGRCWLQLRGHAVSHVMAWMEDTEGHIHMRGGGMTEQRWAIVPSCCCVLRRQPLYFKTVVVSWSNLVECLE